MRSQAAVELPCPGGAKLCERKSPALFWSKAADHQSSDDTQRRRAQEHDDGEPFIRKQSSATSFVFDLADIGAPATFDGHREDIIHVPQSPCNSNLIARDTFERLLDFTLNIMDFILTMINFYAKSDGLYAKMIDFILKMRVITDHDLGERALFWTYLSAQTSGSFTRSGFRKVTRCPMTYRASFRLSASTTRWR